MSAEKKETVVTLFWKDPDRDQVKIVNGHLILDGSWALIVLPPDLWPPGVTQKKLIFPMHEINSIEVIQREAPIPAGYREENTFREVPGSTPVTKGIGGST